MKCGTQTAVAMGAGYLLGRRRKMGVALAVGAAGLTGGLGGIAGQLLRRGTKLLGSSDIVNKVSPEVGEIVNTVRGDLMEAVKSAAVTAVSSRIDSLSDNLRDRAEAMRHPGQVAADLAGTVAGGDEEESEAGADGQQADAEAQGEAGDGAAEERRTPVARRARREPPAEPDEEYEEEEEEAPVPARTRTKRSAGTPPVRRSRR